MSGAGVLRLGGATAVLWLLLILPNHPDAVTWGALAMFPLELPFIVLALLALGRTGVSGLLRGVLAVLLTLLFVLKMADLVSFNALSRGFNPVADLALIDAFVRLLAGTLGTVMAGVAVVAGGLAIIGVAALVWWATGVWARVAPSARAARLAGVAALVPLGISVGEIGDRMGRWDMPVDVPGTAFTARLGVERIRLVGRTLDELAAFRTAAANDPFAGAVGLFEAIDRDVIVVFIESYGRSSFDVPLYADLHRATLARYEAQLGGLGLAMQSGFLGSPTQGGQSWLAHSTFANGLWISNQVSYAAALASGRETLYHHAARNGFRTAALMPQITLDWPESDRMGFDQVLVAADLDYRGLPFNWVTMPDQFTLARLDELLRDGTDDARLFAQVVLVSSHAPWVPVPVIIPWDEVGNGEVFDEMATAGDPVEVVWRDRDRVRAQYRLAVDYSLQAVMEYALLHSDAPPLMIVVGDHRAAERIALDDRNDVPIHVIGPAHLVAALSAGAPHPGLVPPDDAVPIPMDTMRDILLGAYGADAAVAVQESAEPEAGPDADVAPGPGD